MSALTAINDQLALLRTRLGEPEDVDLCRWSPSQLVVELIQSRNKIAEKTRCYQVRDAIAFTTGGSTVVPISAALPAAGAPFLISATNDLVGLYSIEWNGRPLRIVRPPYWRDVVGIDDTLIGDPLVYTYFARQFQLFRVPTAAGTLRLRGWARPPVIVAGGVDTAFTNDASEAALWHCSMKLKGIDERSTDHDSIMLRDAIKELQAQYMPKGPRYVNRGDVATPILL